MAWTGTWRNQYGSQLILMDDGGGRMRGSFRTALRDSGFFGRSYDVVGLSQGNCLAFTFAGSTPKGDMICTFTGLLRDGKMQTVWHVVSDGSPGAGDKQAWPHAVMTNADTFERVVGQGAP
jgi:hypothetical protein